MEKMDELKLEIAEWKLPFEPFQTKKELEYLEANFVDGTEEECVEYFKGKFAEAKAKLKARAKRLGVKWEEEKWI